MTDTPVPSPSPSPSPNPNTEASPSTDQTVSQDTAPHDETGLELARALAQGMRGRPGTKPTTTRSRKSRRRDTELSGAHPDARDPALVGREVDKLVAESGWETDLAVHGVFARWPSIVGSDVAGHCVPESFADGRLRVRTDSTAWATQLRLLAPNVVRRMNEELGHGTVMVIDVMGPDGPSWTKGRRSVRDGRGPRDTYG
jgi:predicted nucleic acid-binding Zn ribbon protein